MARTQFLIDDSHVAFNAERELAAAQYITPDVLRPPHGTTHDRLRVE